MSAGWRDAAGRRHPRAGGDARIACLVPSITELLFALGLGTRVVARTTFCVHPRPAVEAVPRVGGTKTPRLDRIAALGATHAVVNVDENRREDAAALEAQGIEVIVTHPLAPADNPALYALLGGIFGREREADALAGAFHDAHARLRAASAQRPRRRVLYLIWREPWMTVSRDTYISRALADAGLDTVPAASGQRYPELSPGPALAPQIDAVLLPSEPFPFKTAHAAEVRALLGAPGLDVRLVDGEMTSWYGSRAIEACDRLDALARDMAA